MPTVSREVSIVILMSILSLLSVLSQKLVGKCNNVNFNYIAPYTIVSYDVCVDHSVL